MVAVQFPSPALSPVDVVESSLTALKAGDVRRCWRFMSNGRGPNPTSTALLESKLPATQPQLHQASSWEDFNGMVRRTPAYQPLLGCSKFSIVGALPLTQDTYKCRVRVWPAGSSSAPFAVSSPVVDYDWILSLQHLPFTADEQEAEAEHGLAAPNVQAFTNARSSSSGDDSLSGVEGPCEGVESLFWMVDGVLQDRPPTGALIHVI